MTDSSRTTRMFAGACVLAVATIGAAYSNSFQNAFHFDDSHVVESNAFLRSLKNVPLFFRDASTFSSHPANAQYRPLVSTTFALDYWLGGGLKLPQFHRSQLTMLLLLGIAVFFMCLKVMNAAREHW